MNKLSNADICMDKVAISCWYSIGEVVIYTADISVDKVAIYG